MSRTPGPVQRSQTPSTISLRALAYSIESNASKLQPQQAAVDAMGDEYSSRLTRLESIMPASEVVEDLMGFNLGFKSFSEEMEAQMNALSQTISRAA